MTSPSFLLDANVFIEAHQRYYAFDLCPGFWDCLLPLHEAELLCSIDRIRDELAKGNDKLAEWAANQTPSDFFVSTDNAQVIEDYRMMVTWVNEQKQFNEEAKAKFLGNADGWLIASAKAEGKVLVTHEVFAPDAKRNVPIPNICQEFGVACVDTFKMLRDLQVAFKWDSGK